MATKEKQKDVPTEGTFKMKKKAKNLGKKTPTVTKVDLTPQKEEINTAGQPVSEQSKEKKTEAKVELQQVEKPHAEKPDTTEKSKEEVTVIQEVKNTPVEKEIKQPPPTTPIINMPENIQKLVSFMNETGGNIKDYVNLNTSYEEIGDDVVVKEYYKRTKPHLNDEEVNFMMEDKFAFDEDIDEERFVKKQQLAFKEEIAKARGFLNNMKDKYYEELKLRPSVTNEQKKATEFFNRYNQEQSEIASRRDVFVQSTQNYFENDFEGFNFEVGEKKFKYKVSNPFEIANKQTDISKFVNSFMDDKGNISDYQGYHKAMYAARNADTIAQHFYDQGKADATKDIMKKSKNIDTTPRSGDQGELLPNGWKVRALSDGVDSTRLKIKKKTKN